MPKSPRICPKCRASLSSTPVQPNGKVRCPECGVLVVVERPDDPKRAIQTTPGNGLAAVTAAPTAPKDGAAPPMKKNRTWVGLVVVGLVASVLGFFGLALIGGGIGLWFALRPTATPVANAEPTVEKPEPVAKDNQTKEPIKPAAGELPLEELKAASVYIKVSAGSLRGTGSGFVIQSQGDTAYIVTNHHVAAPADPRRPRLRPAVTDLTVVFRSGTPQEQAVKAAVVGDDADADLAVLKATGVRDVPAPLAWEREPKLKETMSVLAFGFPFGDKLDPKQKDPAITVTKGNVSALRLNGGELAEVQLDLDLNPGNSGGPVVDEKGALIGVAVAKVVNSRIGFAVPVPKLHRLLAGHIDPPTTFSTLAVQGQTQYRVAAHAADPLGKLKAPTLLYGSPNEVKMSAQGRDGWEQLAGAKSSPLTLEGASAVAVLPLAPPPKGVLTIVAQVSYQNAAGQTVYGEPRTLSLGAGEPPAPTPTGPVTGEELTKLLTDLKAPDEAVRQKAADTLTKRPPKERLDEVKKGLQALLTAADPATRAGGVRALAACFPKEVPDEAPKLLADEAPAVRQVILQVIRDRKDARYAEAVAARLPTDAFWAGEALKVMGPAAEKVVLPYLADKNPQARATAYHVIKEIGGPASVPALEAALNGPDANIARSTLASVRQRVPLTKDEWPQALDDLKAADAGVRAGAIRRIAVTPPVEERRADVVSRCETLLNDQSGDVKAAAAKALARWGGKDAVPALAKRLEGFDPSFHAAVIEALAEVKDDAAAAAIGKRVADAFDRGKATEALKAMDPLVAEKAVLPLLADTNVFVRVEACKVLADIGGRDSIPPLERLAQDKDPFCPPEAAKALTAIKARLEGAGKK